MALLEQSAQLELEQLEHKVHKVSLAHKVQQETVE
jgi:hypothetical protein